MQVDRIPRFGSYIASESETVTKLVKISQQSSGGLNTNLFPAVYVNYISCGCRHHLQVAVAPRGALFRRVPYRLRGLVADCLAPETLLAAAPLPGLLLHRSSLFSLFISRWVMVLLLGGACGLS